MKKILLPLLLFFILGAGCSYQKDFDKKIELPSMSLKVGTNGVSFDVNPKSESVSNPQAYKFQGADLPAGINPIQIRKVVADKFALVVRPGFIFPCIGSGGVADETCADFAGVLVRENGEQQWRKVLEITDNPKFADEGTLAKNNPIDMWFDGPDGTDDLPNLLIMDQNGGGSGEGVGKVLVAQDIEWENWKVEECFDYAVDLGRGQKHSLSSKYCQNATVKSLW